MAGSVFGLAGSSVGLAGSLSGRLAGSFVDRAAGGFLVRLANRSLGRRPLALLLGQDPGGLSGGPAGLLFGSSAPRGLLGGAPGGLFGRRRPAEGLLSGSLRRTLPGGSFRLGGDSGGLSGLGGLLGGGLSGLAPARLLALGQLGCQVRETRGRRHRWRSLHGPRPRGRRARRFPLPGELQE